MIYSGRQIICTTALVIFTPIALNYENNFFFSKFVFFMKSAISQFLQKAKWTSESKVIDNQTLILFSENWKLAYKRFEIYRSTAILFSPAKMHAISPVTSVPQLCQRTSSGQPGWLAALDASLFTASCESVKKTSMRLPLLQPGVRSGSHAGGGGKQHTDCSVDGLSQPRVEFFCSFLSTMWKYSYKMILGRLHLLWGWHFK